MTTTKTIRTLKRSPYIAGAALLAATLMLGATVVQAADDGTSTTATIKEEAKATVHKTERAASDSWITTKVKSEILANSVTKGLKVGVKTTHGVVALSGKLPTQDAIDVVKLTAEKVKGVKSVDTSALEIGS